MPKPSNPKLTKLNILTPSFVAKDKELSRSDLVNWYLSTQTNSDDQDRVAYPTPGLELYNSFADVEVRGMFQHSGKGFVVKGQDFGYFDETDTYVNIGAISTTTGPVQMAATAIQLLVHDRVKTYIYTFSTGAFEPILDEFFPHDSPTVTAIDGYFLAHQGTQVNFSELLDGTTWPALNYFMADSIQETIVAIYAFKRTVFVMGSRTTETWYNTGGTSVFEPNRGVLIQYGIVAIDSICEGDNQFFFLARGNRGQLAFLGIDESYQDTVVSNEALSNAWKNYPNKADATAFVYQIDGKEFAQISFTEANVSHLYDTGATAWYRTMSLNNQVEGRHLGQYYMFFNDKLLCSDYRNGNVYVMSTDVYTDNGETIIRKLITKCLLSDNNRVIMDIIEIDFENNIADQSGQGSSPTAMLRVSKDAGYTFQPVQYRSFGSLGRYTQRALWNRQGQGRKFVLEIAVSDPVKWVIQAAYAKVRLLDN